MYCMQIKKTHIQLPIVTLLSNLNQLLIMDLYGLSKRLIIDHLIT